MLLISAAVVAVLSAGLKSIELTTDPVDLWSAPNSRARQEKDFHDRNFDPFFRTNQLILTAPGRKGEEYDSLLFGKYNFSGIVSKELIIEMLELQTRIQVRRSGANLATDSAMKKLELMRLRLLVCHFAEHRVLVRGSEPHCKSEGRLFRTSEPRQLHPDRLCGQQFAAVLPKQPGEHQRQGEHDKAGKDQGSGLERPLNLLLQVRIHV